MLPEMSPPAPEGLHRRLLPDVVDACVPVTAVLAGAYAVRAHGLGGRPGRDLEFVTDAPPPMAEIAAALRAGLEERGWQVRPVSADPLAARLTVADPTTGEECAVDLRKETLWRPPVPTEYGPVPAVEDVVGLEVRALADLGLARSLVDVRAAAARWSAVELEELGRRHARDAVFDLTDLQARLAGAEWIDDSEFTAQGLDEAAVAGLRRWAQAWADDIAERLMEEAAYEDE
ncbi:hypothetical protein QZH56_18550 [Streptomyces olivoreticuli]|uniref:hypothetical protein n=1 Tax=Streptomyces olivoreticuli TaxID=68246 RepID=UPI002658D615|nr:hypothetical protein [Streptomyces olivoreticuli]WKK20900.1 hypothetical protein QZH56_18550 [Streptomyces olivoreticuli]